MAPLRTLTASRYVQPLREGGSLPAVVDTEDGLFVVKFRGAGQGPKALLAELIVGGVAAALELPVPELVLVDVAEEFGRSEPDPEIQDLLCRSRGINVGLRYLDGAFNFALAAAGDFITADFAARLVWLDAYTTNPDRSHRNPNLLIHERRPWLIDHGAALYVHHDWESATPARTRAPFPMIRDHVLLTAASDITAVDDVCADAVARALDDVLATLPDALLLDAVGGEEFASGAAARSRYADWLGTRLAAPRAFAADAAEQQERRRAEPPRALQARR